MSDHVNIVKANGVVEISLDRAERRNAITTRMYAALAAAFEDASGDPGVEIIILSGSDTVFTAGNDLIDFRDNPPFLPNDPDILQAAVFRFMRNLLRCPKVVIAAVEGLAVGIGTTLLLHCDLVVAGSGAKFIVPFVNLGLLPEFASSRLLPEMMGRQRAARHILLGEPFDTDTAFTCGLVSEVVTDGAAMAAARKMALQLMRKPPKALAQTKSMMAPDAAEIEALIEREARSFAACLAGDELPEAVNAFFEKREPRFTRATGGSAGA